MVGVVGFQDCQENQVRFVSKGIPAYVTRQPNTHHVIMSCKGQGGQRGLGQGGLGSGWGKDVLHDSNDDADVTPQCRPDFVALGLKIHQLSARVAKRSKYSFVSYFCRLSLKQRKLLDHPGQ